MVCFSFTFAALSEYCVVLYLVKAADWYEKEKKSKGRAKETNKFKLKIAYVVEKWCGLWPLPYLSSATLQNTAGQTRLWNATLRTLNSSLLNFEPLLLHNTYHNIA